MPQDERRAYIDMEDGLGRVRGNKSLYKRMLGMFTQSTEFTAFEEAMSAEDYARAAEVAHGIKGMTGNLGLTRIFQLSAEIMTKFQVGDIDQALVAEYRQALEKTRGYVDEVIAELG